jgi:hypothetical protein
VPGSGVRAWWGAAAATFTGSATGLRYHVEENSVIETNAAGATFFPGNAAGTTTTGGQYN